PSVGKLGCYAFQKIEDQKSRRGFELAFEETHLIDIQRWAAPLTIRMTSQWPESAIVIRIKDSFNNGEWKHLGVAYDGSGKAAGVKVYLDGKLAEVEILKDSLTGSIKNSAEMIIGSKESGRAYSGGLDDLRFYSRALTRVEIEQIAIHYPVQTILSGISGKR